jgi:hypothetical protein
VNRKVLLIVAAAGACLLGLMIYSTASLGGYRVEVCKEFRGQQACGTAEGSSESAARHTATQVACAKISSGMTAPVKITWLSGKPDR